MPNAGVKPKGLVCLFIGVGAEFAHVLPVKQYKSMVWYSDLTLGYVRDVSSDLLQGTGTE